MRWRRRWGPQEEQPLEVPWSKVLKIGIDVQVDLDAEAHRGIGLGALGARHIIGRIPGA